MHGREAVVVLVGGGGGECGWIQGCSEGREGEVDGDKIAGLQCGRSKSILIRVTVTK